MEYFKYDSNLIKNNVMEKPTKLQETELQELKDFQNQSESLIAQLGQLSFRKLQLEKEEQYLKQAFEQIVAAEVKLSKKLKETYGDIQIDLKEGDIIYS
jgi:hypothetical protein